MKSIVVLLAIFVMPLVLLAQDWNPILTAQKMNYRHSDSLYITNTIWVDSTSPSQWDTIYHFNTIVKDHPTDSTRVIRNQSDFLKRYMHRQNEESYMFYDPKTNSLFVIMPFATIGESWLFEPGVPIHAEVLSMEVMEVFGTNDSVRVIGLTDGNEILLSRSFGILKFPDFENGGYFELAGIQGTEYGESVPGFWEVFDFEVGDVYQYMEDTGDPFGSGTITRKIVITSKETLPNAYHYGVYGLYHCVYMNAGGGGGIISYSYTEDLVFTDSTGHPANLFSNELYLVPDSWTDYGTHKVFTKTKIYDHPGYETICKELGPKEESNIMFQADLFYEADENNDTLHKLLFPSTLGEPCGLMGHGFGNQIGQTYSSSGCFEYWENVVLTGFVKDGDTTGAITPDSLLLVGMKNHFKSLETYHVYPNPATDQVIVENKGKLGSGETILVIHNNSSMQVLRVRLEALKNLISTADFEAGPYTYGIYCGGIRVSAGKLIIR